MNLRLSSCLLAFLLFFSVSTWGKPTGKSKNPDADAEAYYQALLGLTQEREFEEKSYLSLFSDYSGLKDVALGLSLNLTLDPRSRLNLAMAKLQNIDDSSVLNALEYRISLEKRSGDNSQFSFTFKHLRQKQGFRTHNLSVAYQLTLDDWEFLVVPEFRLIVVELLSGSVSEVDTSSTGIGGGVTYTGLAPWQFGLTYNQYFYDRLATRLAGVSAATVISQSAFLFSSGFLKQRAAINVGYFFRKWSPDAELSWLRSFVDDRETWVMSPGLTWMPNQIWALGLRGGRSMSKGGSSSMYGSFWASMAF